jgi:competence protein ComEC
VRSRALCLLIALGAVALWRGNERAARDDRVRGARLLAAAGLGVVWARSAMVGRRPIARPLRRDSTGACSSGSSNRARARAAGARHARAGSGRAIKVRVNVPLEQTGRT